VTRRLAFGFDARFLRGLSGFATLLSRLDMSQRASRRSRTSKPAGKPASIQLLPVMGLPEFRAGDNLARAIFEAARKSRIAFENGDVLVIAQKIVSKVEGRIVDLSTIPASQAAHDLAAKLQKDARLVEVILRESRRIVTASSAPTQASINRMCLVATRFRFYLATPMPRRAISLHGCENLRASASL
jgi:hypothetical protein